MNGRPHFKRSASKAFATFQNLTLGSVWVVLLFCVPGIVVAQTAKPSSAPLAFPQDKSPAIAFDIDLQAPTELQTFLLRNIELQRYQAMNDLDDIELERLLTATRTNLIDLMGTLGYFSPQIQIDVQAVPQNSAARRRVLIVVVPNEPVKITDVTIEFKGDISEGDATEALRMAIRSAWSLRRDMTFTQSSWDAAKTQALRLLTRQRYPAGQISHSLADIDPDRKTAALKVVLDSGPLYRLGLLRISGLQRFDEQLVERLARLESGKPYLQDDLLEAQQRLVDSGFFDSVFVSLDTAGALGEAPVLIQLREAKLQKIVFGIGANTDSGLRLSMEHTHHKVPGIGWRAVSKLSLDRDTKSLESELTSPPDETSTRWVTSALIQNQASGSFDVDSQRYRLGRAQTGDQIDRNYYVQYDRANMSAGGVSNSANAFTVNYAWVKRSFDSLPFPSSGYGLGAEIGGGITLESSRQPYFRAQVRWLALWPLFSGAADPGTSRMAGRLATRAEFGAVVAREGADLPSTQLFLAGGDTSVRGYGFRSIGTELANGVIAPGRYLAAGSIEWQRPIIVSGVSTDWESAVFVDAGAVADTMSSLSAKVGVGVGARWKSPVGPLQIDLGYGVAVKAFRLHLSMGFTF